MMPLEPIGIFDSGLGGLSVWLELVKLLPNESLIYYADSARCPYGEKSAAEIIEFSQQITDFLIQKGCKMIVVACNTATSAAIDTLRASYPIPFVGIEPAVKQAALSTKTGNIGVLATKGTFAGRLYQETSRKFANGVNLHVQVGTGLVELVEEGKTESLEAQTLIASYILPMLAANVDELVLGCTHYPFLIPIIDQITQGKIHTINPAPAVARRAQQLLTLHQIYNSANHQATYEFYTSGSKSRLEDILKRISQVPYFIH